MKKLILILSCFLLTLSPFAQQNLVPNSSFEDTVQCPTPNSQIEYSAGWINPNGYSPDYFHSCANSSNPNYGTPYNLYGFQNPKTGVAYAGIYLPVNAGNDLREYIQIQLLETLISGVKYVVKFNVSLADSSIFSVNSLGAYLSNTAINSPTLKVFNVTPQVVNNPITNPLVDKNIWYEISDTITAVGGEKFITIGNFQFDSVADTTTVVGGGSSSSFASYYYIDDVSLTKIVSTSIDEILQNNITIFPNPTTGIIWLSSNERIKSYTIYSALGQLIKNDIVNTEKLQISLDNYPAGIYFLIIETNSSFIHKQIFINH
jgi:hypothetical protein